MPQPMTCYMKKKIGKCYEEELYHLSKEVERLKRARMYLKQQTMQVVTQLEQQQFPICAQPISYLDGFTWRKDQSCLGVCSYLSCITEEKSTRQTRICAFKANNCEGVFLAQKSMKAYLNHQFTEELVQYNEMLLLYEAVWCVHKNYLEHEAPFVRFSLLPDINCACYWSRALKTFTETETQEMIFFEKDKLRNIYRHISIRVKKTADENILQQLRALHLEEGELLLQLCDLQHWVGEQATFKWGCLITLFKQRLDKVPNGIGFYGYLGDLPPEEKAVGIKYFRQNGFKILGCFEEETYRSEYFVYRYIEI